MSPDEMAEAVLQSFDTGQVAKHLKSEKVTWFIDGRWKTPTAREVRQSARKLILDLLHDKPEVSAIESGGMMVVRRGTRVSIGYVPVHSTEFP